MNEHIDPDVVSLVWLNLTDLYITSAGKLMVLHPDEAGNNPVCQNCNDFSMAS